jgi:hypothetical protein
MNFSAASSFPRLIDRLKQLMLLLGKFTREPDAYTML